MADKDGKKPEKVLDAQAPVRDCCDCGEGLCCGEKHGLVVISSESIIEKVKNPCGGCKGVDCPAQGVSCSGNE